MTREMYETLPLSELRQLAKARNLKGVSTLRKQELINVMLSEDEKLAEKDAEKSPAKHTPSQASAQKKESHTSGRERKSAAEAPAHEANENKDDERAEGFIKPGVQELDSGLEANGL